MRREHPAGSSNAEPAEALEQLVVSRSVVPVIDKVFPLEQAAQAFAAQESGGTVGKVVIRIANP